MNKMPPYVQEFLEAVLTSDGGKHPVASYYPAEESEDLPRPSWAIAEENGWVECVGSHAWRITPAGKRAYATALLESGHE